jgi:hypothetical protein
VANLPQLLANRARCYLHLRQLDKAQNDINRAIDLDPKHADARNMQSLHEEYESGMHDELQEIAPAYLSSTVLMLAKAASQDEEIAELKAILEQKERDVSSLNSTLQYVTDRQARAELQLCKYDSQNNFLEKKLRMLVVKTDLNSGILKTQMETIQKLEDFKKLYALNGVESASVAINTPMMDTQSELHERGREDTRRRLRILEEKRLQVMAEGASVQIMHSDGEPEGKRWATSEFIRIQQSKSGFFELACGADMASINSQAPGTHFLDLKQAHTVAHGSRSQGLVDCIQCGLLNDPQLCFSVVVTKKDGRPHFLDIKVLDRPSLDVWFRGLQTLVFSNEMSPAGFQLSASGVRKYSQGKLIWKWFLCKYRHKAGVREPPEMFHEYVRREVRKAEMLHLTSSGH